MGYKFTTGSVRRGDVYYEDDRTGAATYIDFGQDTITLRPSGSQILHAQADAVGIGTTSPDYTLDVAGDIGVDQYIYHNGDADTFINFADDKIVLKAGNRAMVTAEVRNSQPHEVTINDGSNNIDFVVKGNGSRGGNPGMKFDASTNKLGINGVGTPEESLHVDGNIKVFGDDVRIKIDGDTDSHPGIELYENGTRKWIVYNDYTNDNLTFKTNSDVRMSIKQDGKVGIGTNTPGEILTIQGTESGTDETYIHFLEDNSDRALIGINSSNNLVLHNQFSNKHIVFKVNDAGTTREGLRIRSNNDDNRGEVVVNEGSESLIDFRVEGSTDQHLIFADGGNDKVGISTNTPTSGMHIRTSIATSFQVNDTNVTLDDEDCFVIADAANGSITITLPSPTGIGGRFYTIKRKDTSGNSVTITTAAGKTFDGSGSSFTLSPLCSITLRSDNASNWWKVAEFIDPP